MKKVSTGAARQTRNFRGQELTIRFGSGRSIQLVTVRRCASVGQTISQADVLCGISSSLVSVHAVDGEELKLPTTIRYCSSAVLL